MVKYVFIILVSVSCANIFEESAKKDTDAAVLFQARTLMDKYQWTEAIEKILSLSSSYLAKREVKALLASAYAGRCGLDFITISENLKTPGTSNLFEILLRAFPGATATQVTDCITAETTLKTISDDATNRTVDENLLMAFIGFSKMAVIASVNLDTDGDGAADGGGDPCAISNTHAAEMITGLANALISLGQAGVDIGGDQTTDISAACDQLPPSENICNLTDTADVTSMEHRQAMRGIVNETTGGLGLRYCNDDISVCAVGCGT